MKVVREEEKSMLKGYLRRRRAAASEERILIEFSAKQTFIHIKEFFITKKVLNKESGVIFDKTRILAHFKL